MCKYLGVDNGRGGGIENIVGEHCVKINGNVYTYIPKTGTNGGITYFTYDAQDQMLRNMQTRNSQHPQYDEPIIKNFLIRIFEELKSINEFTEDLQLVGNYVTQHDENNTNYTELTATVNQQTSNIDISGITSDNHTGNLVIKYKIRGLDHEVPCNSNLISYIFICLYFYIHGTL